MQAVRRDEEAHRAESVDRALERGASATGDQANRPPSDNSISAMRVG